MRFAWTKKTVTTPVIIDHIHNVNLRNHRISAKSIPEQLGYSRHWNGSFIHEHLDMRKLSAKLVPEFQIANQNRQWCQCLDNILNFSARLK